MLAGRDRAMEFALFSLPGLLLCGTFFFAGIIDAVCGGGGLLTLPMFMATGFPVHMITGTNQCSIFFGGATSLVRFAKSGHVHWPTALMTIPFAMIGATLGARLNMMIPESYLEIIMMLLVPVVAVVLLLKRDFGSENHASSLSTRQCICSALATGLIIGAYQGFYGAGAGTFFMLAFAVLMKLDLTTASGNTKVVSFCSVTTASLSYVFNGMVYWPVVIAATVFNVVGSYVGAGLAMHKGARFIRPMFFMVLALLFIRLIFTWIG